jgi:hypothetical protein
MKCGSRRINGVSKQNLALINTIKEQNIKSNCQSIFICGLEPHYSILWVGLKPNAFSKQNKDEELIRQKNSSKKRFALLFNI